MPSITSPSIIVSSNQIAPGIIVNSDVSASAAIDLSKLAGAAASGANADITSLSGLSTPLSLSQGGTGQTTLAAVINALAKFSHKNVTEKTFTNGNGGNGAGTAADIFSVTIPGGTLGTGNVLRFFIRISTIGYPANASAWVFLVKYGGTTIGTLDLGANSSQKLGLSGWIEGFLCADGSASVQKAWSRCYLQSVNTKEYAAAANVVQDKIELDGGVGTAAVDSTTDQTFVITGDTLNDADADATFEFFIVEAI